MKKIKVSVVVPIYNIEKYLKKCLDSIVNQSYKDIEIILVDDGSSDNSGKICDDYAKNNQRIIVLHQKNGGVSSARNSGIKKASGEYVCFVDSDDLVHPNYIKMLVENLNSDTLSVCRIENFKDSVSFNVKEEGKIELDKNHFIELCKMVLLNTPCCKLYNLDIIRENKIFFDTKLSLGEDLLFNLNYLNYIDRIVITNQRLYYYRRDENSTLSTAYNPNMSDIQFLLFDKYTDFFKNIKMDSEMLTIFDSYRLSILTIIIENEFKNKNISFHKRYFNVKRLIRSNEMKERIKKIRHPRKKLVCFLLRHNLILSYKIVNKVKSLM